MTTSSLASKLILGIDPGIQGGAYAFYRLVDGAIEEVSSFPLLEEKRGKKVRFIIDKKELCYRFLKVADRCVLAVVERVHSMPGQGVSSTFRFGESFGLVQGILCACNIETIMIEPAVWKGLMGISGLGNKEGSRELAGKIFPEIRHEWRYKKDHNLAEAALIAKFGERIVRDGGLF
jgi:hypothetical protein